MNPDFHYPVIKTALKFGSVGGVICAVAVFLSISIYLLTAKDQGDANWAIFVIIPAMIVLIPLIVIPPYLIMGFILSFFQFKLDSNIKYLILLLISLSMIYVTLFIGNRWFGNSHNNDLLDINNWKDFLYHIFFVGIFTISSLVAGFTAFPKE